MEVNSELLKIPKKEPVKRWPWWLRWITPDASERKIIRCSCGRVMWLDAPDKVRKHHSGHRMDRTDSASMWSFIKMKLNLLDCRTATEWGKDILGRFER